MWRVFVPHTLLTECSGMLTGIVNNKSGFIYVSGISETENTNVIGLWLSNKSHPSTQCTKKTFLYLSKSSSGHIICDLVLDGSLELSSCVIFSPDDLSESYFVSCGVNNNVFCDLLRCVERKRPNNDRSMSILSGFIMVFLPLNFLLQNKCIQNFSILKRLIETPAIGHQLILRCSQNKAAHSMETSNNLSLKNITYRQLVDTVIGLALLYLLMYSDVVSRTTVCVLQWADYTADELTVLLNWLMGAPAGLKLNTQLTEFLGQFFLYHIHLWKGYLSLIQPVLGQMLSYSLMVGILGFSAQVCLLQDIISMMTLHIYCFYVYAARLYRLQVYTLSALWRLFRGKKWNVLRHRVDSTCFDVDQLFVGTLLFTILLFMLPTTILYYTVFTLLRMCVLLVQGLLSSVVNTINHIPVYSILMWAVRSKAMAGDILFHVLPSGHSGKSSVFSMQLCCSGLSKVVKLTHKLCSPHTTHTQRSSYGDFLRHLLKGHLVFPWIDLQSK